MRILKYINLGPKLLFLGIFRLTFERKPSLIFEATSNFPKYQVSCKLKFETKIAYLGVLGKNFKKLLPYLKLTLSNLSKCKVLCKTKKFEI